MQEHTEKIRNSEKKKVQIKIEVMEGQTFY